MRTDLEAPRLDELAAAAIMGVANRQVDLTTAPQPLKPAATEPAEALLDTAALVTSGLRTRIPLAAVRAVAPPAPETWPQISPVVDHLLQRLDDDRELLLIALERIAESGQVLTPQRLPGLLAQTEISHPGGSRLAAAVVPVLGTVGAWIAAQNPRWETLVHPIERGWPQGQPALQVAWFQRARRMDPHAAAELLAAEVDELSPQTRADLVRSLGPQLSAADTPLIDRLADDRSSKVREAAERLALHLPDSRLATVGRDLLARSVTVRRSGIRLSVEGQAATAVIAAVPPHSWPDVLGVDAPTALTRPGGNVLVEGLRASTLTFGDRPTARALLRFSTEDQPELWFGLDDEDRIDRIMTALATNPPAGVDALQAWKTWPSQLSRRLAFRLEQQIRTTHRRSLLSEWVSGVPDDDLVAAADYARQLAIESNQLGDQRAWEGAASRLNLRASIVRNLPLDRGQSPTGYATDRPASPPSHPPRI